MKLEIQIEQLYQKLNAALDNFSRDERFYTVRELCERFKANRRVVDATLKRMAQEKLIRCESCVGIFCNVSRRPHARKLLFVSPDWPSSGLSRWREVMFDFTRQNPQYSLRNVLFDPLRPFMSNLGLNGMDALIIYKSALPFTSSELNALTNWGKPIVLINAKVNINPFCAINDDTVQGGMLAADCLIRYGHRKLMVLVTESSQNNPEVKQRVHSFQTYAELQGATVTILDCQTRNAEPSNRKAYETLSGHLKQYGCTFTGLFVVADATVPGALAALYEYGLKVPENVSIVGCDGLEEGAFYQPPLTTVTCPLKPRVERLFAELELCWSGKQQNFDIEFPMELLERRSCGPCPV